MTRWKKLNASLVQKETPRSFKRYTSIVHFTKRKLHTQNTTLDRTQHPSLELSISYARGSRPLPLMHFTPNRLKKDARTSSKPTSHAVPPSSVSLSVYPLNYFDFIGINSHNTYKNFIKGFTPLLPPFWLWWHARTRHTPLRRRNGRPFMRNSHPLLTSIFCLSSLNRR